MKVFNLNDNNKKIEINHNYGDTSLEKDDYFT